MTEKQQKYRYWPAWFAVCRKLGWRMVDARLQVEEGKLNEYSRRVVTAANRMAMQEHRAAKLDDLRHALHAVALGRDKSSKDFTNAELDRFLAFAALILDQENIGADLRLGNPEIAQREALVAGIRKLIIPDAIIDQTCRNYFRRVYNPPHWHQLPLGCLRTLAGKLRAEKEKYLAEYAAPHPGPLPIAPPTPQRGEGDMPRTETLSA